MIKASELNTDKLVLDIEAFDVLQAFITCNSDDKNWEMLRALYDRYILRLDHEIKDEKTRAVFGAVVAIIDGNLASKATDAPKSEPAKPQPVATQPCKRAKPLHLPHRVKFFIALMHKDAKEHGEDFFEKLKNPLNMALRYGRGSECTPKVEHWAKKWVNNVKPTSAGAEARLWGRVYKDKIERGYYKDPVETIFGNQ